MTGLTFEEIKKKPILVDFLYAILFGLLSVFFGLLKIYVPEFEGAVADFREIPLLIAILHHRSRRFILVMCLLTTLTPSSFSFATVFLMHYFALLFASYTYRFFFKNIEVDWHRALAWVGLCFVYYVAFIIPILLLVNNWERPVENFSFTSSYLLLLAPVKYEMLVTMLVTTIYLVQVDIRRRLRKHKANLKREVAERTKEANQRKHELELVVENQDQRIAEGSLQVRKQFVAFNKYAAMTSHELRSPMANILGLVSVLKKKRSEEERMELIRDLGVSATKLNEVIGKMNELLEEEVKKHRSTSNS